MTQIDDSAIRALEESIDSRIKSIATNRTSSHVAEVVDIDSDGTIWIHVFGGASKTPVTTSLATVSKGDIVTATIADGSVTINGSSSSPSATINYVDELNAILGEYTRNAIAGVLNDIMRVEVVIARKASIEDLTATNAAVSTLTANFANLNTIVAGKVDTTYLEANYATLNDLSATNVVVTNLTASFADLSEVVADKVDASYLEANYAEIDLANVNNAWINNGVVRDGAITNAMINSVSANKLTAGTIDASNITVTNLNASNITTGTINGQRIGTGSLSLDKLADDVYTETEIDSMLSSMQSQIDGAIETWTGTDVPTLNNSPASGWTTDTMKDTHVGDVYFVVNSSSQQNGYNYRFTKSGNTYSWQLIKDSDVTNALQRITTAEGQITQFSSDISTLQTDTGTLKTRADNLETSLGDKVSTTTFNSLSSTVDSNTAAITSQGTVLQNNGLTSTTNITNTVNTVSQTATGNSSKITQLVSTLGTNADGTTKTGDIVHRTSAVEQDLAGFKTTVSSTYATKSELATEASRITTAETSITQNAEAIALKANANDVYTKTAANALLEVKANKATLTSEINASADTVKISADRVNIEGAAIFTTGRLSSTSLNNAYDSKGSAAAAQAAAIAAIPTDISEFNNDAGYQTSTDVEDAISTVMNDALEETQLIYIQAESVMSEITTPINWVIRSGESLDGDHNMLEDVPTTDNPTGYLAYTIPMSEPLTPEYEQDGRIVTTSYTLRLWDVTLSHSGKTAANLNVSVYYCGDTVRLGSWNALDYFVETETAGVYHADRLEMTFTPTTTDITTNAGTSSSNLSHSSASNVTNADIRLYNSPNNASGTKLLTVGRWNLELGGPPAWTVKRPTYHESYPVVFVATQTKRMDDTITCTEPLVDDTTTVIDGGHIITGIIDAAKINVVNLDASNITTGTLSASRIDTENLMVSQSNVSGLSQMLTDLEDGLSSQIDGLSNDMGVITDKLEADDQAINERVAAIESHVSIGTNSLGQPSILLDATGGTAEFDGMSAELTNTQLSFLDHGQVVSYISNQKQYITEAEVTGNMRVGKFAWIPLASDGLGFKWTG